ncbi:class I SAM-dependent methyltransferase [Planctomycetaceae bacterium]|nr:class I SAM-dependent methyltransferase [Planctomycetaceae bacterium]
MTAPTDSGYRQSHQGCGTEYHSQFSDNPRRRMMWQIEQAMLEDILEATRQQSTDEITYLDFACGTGRVLGFVSEHTNTATGVDVSDSMLEVAATSAPGAELISADITQDDSPLSGRHFELITAFRFFPNAEPGLRSEAIRALADCLSPDGRLVFNNHRCLSSMRHRLVRLLTLGRKGRTGMTRHEVLQLVSEAGLEIERVEHAGVVPEYEWLLLRPRWVVEWIERLATRLPLVGIAENLVYVCRRPRAATVRRHAA